MYQVVWLRNMPLLSVHCVRFVTYLPNCIRLSNNSLSTCPLYAVTQQLFIYLSFVSSYTANFYLLALCIRSPKDCTYLSIVDPFTVFPYPTVFDVQHSYSYLPIVTGHTTSYSYLPIVTGYTIRLIYLFIVSGYPTRL